MNEPILSGRAGQTQNIAPANDLIPATPGVEFSVCRSLLVGTGGTATLVMASGETRTDVPLQVGYNPLRITQVVSLGTAADVWRVY